MSSSIPNYYEVRMTLTDLESLLTHYVGGSTVINIGETMRMMLGEYFYGEPPVTLYPHYTCMDRTLVWPLIGQTLFGMDLDNAIDAMGEVFWSLADTITNNALAINNDYTHKPTDCFYNFFPDTRILVVYTPVMPEVQYNLKLLPLDGRAVMETCKSTLPSWLTFS